MRNAIRKAPFILMLAGSIFFASSTISYNWGSGNIQRKGLENMPQETRDYIQKVTSRMGQPQQYASAGNVMTDAVVDNAPTELPEGAVLLDNAPTELPEGAVLIDDVAPQQAAPEVSRGRTAGGAPTKLPEGAVLLDDKTPPPPEGFTLESPPSEAAVDAEIAALEAELAKTDKEQKSEALAWIEDTLFFMMQATIAIVCFLLYISPAIIAWKRRHQNKIPILLLNVVAGWTGLGWVAALIWASKAPTKQG